jgi:hypothetical protein
MKSMITILVAALLAACGSLEKEVQSTSTPELQLRLHQARARMNGPHYSSGRFGDDGGISNDTEEKEVIERELMRRGRLHTTDITVW